MWTNTWSFPPSDSKIQKKNDGEIFTNQRLEVQHSCSSIIPEPGGGASVDGFLPSKPTLAQPEKNPAWRGERKRVGKLLGWVMMSFRHVKWLWVTWKRYEWQPLRETLRMPDSLHRNSFTGPVTTLLDPLQKVWLQYTYICARLVYTRYDTPNAASHIKYLNQEIMFISYFKKLSTQLSCNHFWSLTVIMSAHVSPQNVTTSRIAFKALPSPCPPRRQPNAADAKLADLSGHQNMMFI